MPSPPRGPSVERPLEILPDSARRRCCSVMCRRVVSSEWRRRPQQQLGAKRRPASRVWAAASATGCCVVATRFRTSSTRRSRRCRPVRRSAHSLGCRAFTVKIMCSSGVVSGTTVRALVLGPFTHTHTHPFNDPFSGTTRVSRYQKGKNQSGFYGSKRQ